jgi:hypothetical protein
MIAVSRRPETGAIPDGMDEAPHHPKQLGDFLKSRRAQLTPAQHEDFGTPRGRRTL